MGDVPVLIFWIKSWTVVGLMSFFIIFAACDFPHWIDKAIRGLQDFHHFRAETKRGATNGFSHLVLKVLKAQKFMIYRLIEFVSTLLISTICLAVAQALDCNPGEGELETVKFVEKYGNRIECYTGIHRALWLCLCPITLLYFFLLVPYATCAGDASYVPHSTLRDFRFWREESMWKQAAKRKATDVNLGFLHPMPDNAFRTLAVDLFVKIALPIITTETHGYPEVFMVLAVGVVQLYDVCMYQPYVEEKFSAVLICLKMASVSAMSTGLLTLYVNDRTSIVPMMVLVVLLLVILALFIYSMFKLSFRHARVSIYTAEDPNGVDAGRTNSDTFGG